MNPGEIWWGQIGNSLRFLTFVTNTLRDCHSAVLQVPKALPWRQVFYTAVDVRRAGFSAERRLIRLPWEGYEDPGAFVLNELCTSQTRADYWPGQTYAAYLASKDDIVLNDYYVWITGIHSKADLVKWADFVTQYTRGSAQPERRAVYILEYDGPDADVSGVDKLVYTVENYDCRVFCLETTAGLNNSSLRTYQAELALCIGNHDPELCSALLDRGDSLLQDTPKIAAEVLEFARSSNGSSFQALSEQQINSAAWKAAIGLLFPILEQYRLEFIANHEGILYRHLPISNSNGDRITDPYDLEIGSIYYIIGTAEKEFTAVEADNIRFCRKVRNLLAHNKPLPYPDIVKSISLA